MKNLIPISEVFAEIKRAKNENNSKSDNKGGEIKAKDWRKKVEDINIQAQHLDAPAPARRRTGSGLNSPGSSGSTGGVSGSPSHAPRRHTLAKAVSFKFTEAQMPPPLPLNAANQALLN